MEQDQDYGLSSYASFAQYDPNMRLWKMSQGCLFEGWGWYSEAWPKSGMMQSGKCYPQPCLVDTTEDYAFTLWPTPQAVDYKESFRSLKTLKHQFDNHQIKWPMIILMNHYSQTEEYGQAHPEFGEWLMGLPIGYTDLKQSATAKTLALQSGSEKE